VVRREETEEAIFVVSNWGRASDRRYYSKYQAMTSASLSGSPKRIQNKPSTFP